MSECVFRIATTEALFYEILKKYFLKLVFYVFLNCFNVLMIKINFKKLIKYYFIVFKNKITFQKIIYTAPHYQTPMNIQVKTNGQGKTIQYKARWFKTCSRKIRFTRQDKWQNILSRCR
jgi:hypothetical protein